jgi:two-component system, LytTR family, response regulator
VKAIIVDDERLARANLLKLLETYPEIEIAGEAGSCKAAVELINIHNPQLVFLDIQLSGETGFDLLTVTGKSIKIIFVTAFDEYAIRAFEVNAVDYLLKPVNPERLGESIGRVMNNNEKQDCGTTRYDYSDSIYVQLNNYTSRFIKISSITFIEPIGNYSRIVTTDGKHYLVLKTLKQWEEELPFTNFKRIHRSSIINIDHLERIEKRTDSHHRAFLKNIPEPLDVSRRYARKLKAFN